MVFKSQAGWMEVKTGNRRRNTKQWFVIKPGKIERHTDPYSEVSTANLPSYESSYLMIGR